MFEINALTELIYSRCLQIRSLRILRDSLLQKFTSGEVQVQL